MYLTFKGTYVEINVKDMTMLMMYICTTFFLTTNFQ